MKKLLSVLLIALLLLAACGVLGGGVYFLLAIDRDVPVFDLANLLCTALFSLIAIAISLYELAKNLRQEKINAAKEKETAAIKAHLNAMIEVKQAEIEAIKQIRAIEIIEDYPTYSDLPVKRLCELFEAFHTTSLSKAEKAMQAYIRSARSAIALVIENGACLPASIMSLALSMSERIDRLEAEFTRFEGMSSINYWKLLMANAIGEDDPTADTVRDRLYEEGCQLCLAYTELYTKVTQSLEWFKVLCRSLK